MLRCVARWIRFISGKPSAAESRTPPSTNQLIPQTSKFSPFQQLEPFSIQELVDDELTGVVGREEGGGWGKNVTSPGGEGAEVIDKIHLVVIWIFAHKVDDRSS